MTDFSILTYTGLKSFSALKPYIHMPQLAHKAKSPPYIFDFLIIYYTLKYVTLRKKFHFIATLNAQYGHRGQLLYSQ